MHLIKYIVGVPISVAELATLKFYPPEFVATCVFETKTARISRMHFRTVGGQDSHVHGALLIGSGAICK